MSFEQTNFSHNASERGKTTTSTMTKKNNQNKVPSMKRGKYLVKIKYS